MGKHINLQKIKNISAPEAAPDSEKRKWLALLGSVFTTACAPPQNNHRIPATKSTEYDPPIADASSPGEIVETQVNQQVTAQQTVSQLQTFSALGPVNISLQASDMTMNTNQIMANGNGIRVWGFTDDSGAAFNGQSNRICPGPVIEIIEGELSSISLTSMHPHTIHLHGLDVDMANDGVPTTSGFVSAMTMPGGPIPVPDGVNLGNPFSYTFIAPHAGTYMYHCHVDTVLHMEMGMYGSIVVRPANGSRNVSWVGSSIFDKEYIWQLHTFDSRWHNGDLVSGSNTQRYNPDYFLINGLDGNHLFTDPATAISGAPGQRILLRLVNLGYMPARFNLGGLPFDVEASDGRPLKTVLTAQHELLIGPGERYDVFVTLPPPGTRITAVNYLDITGRRIIGQAICSITSQ